MSYPHVCRGSLKAHKKLTFLNSCTKQNIYIVLRTLERNGPLNTKRCQQLVQKWGSPWADITLLRDPRTQYLGRYHALFRASINARRLHPDFIYSGILGKFAHSSRVATNIALSKKTLRFPTRPTIFPSASAPFFLHFLTLSVSEFAIVFFFFFFFFFFFVLEFSHCFVDLFHFAVWLVSVREVSQRFHLCVFFPYRRFHILQVCLHLFVVNCVIIVVIIIIIIIIITILTSSQWLGIYSI